MEKRVGKGGKWLRENVNEGDMDDTSVIPCRGSLGWAMEVWADHGGSAER